MTYVLGISAFYHDSAAALLKNGEIVSAVQEERFSRIKNDSGFPVNAIEWILSNSKISMADINHVIFYEKPFNKFERLLETCIRFAPKGYELFSQALPMWLKEKLFQKLELRRRLSALPGGSEWNHSILFSEHHLSHAAAAFYSSPFESAAIITIDGVGEWATTTISIAHGGRIERLKELRFPHSFGLLYSTITAFLGFKVNSGEYKVMGLAPYGRPIYAEKIKNNLIEIKPDGSFRLRMKYFGFASRLKMYTPALAKLFGIEARHPEGPLESVHMDIAASLQSVTDELFLGLSRYARELTGQENLCLAGGVALNCVSTGRILRSKIFDKLWIQPAAGDAGSALGAAQAGYYLYCKKPRVPCQDYMPYLGPCIDHDIALRQLEQLSAKYSIIPDETIFESIADALAKGKIVAWVQGRAEFSPRALGNRSILADPRVKDLKKSLNLKIKFRESFRPFAPVILAEEANNWFDMVESSPHMNFTVQANDGVDQITPSVIHVDGSARLQTVSIANNERLYRLIHEFQNLTACPMLVNTSFNVRGEPMVLSTEDAFNCFMNTGIDMLVIGNIVLDKYQQDGSKYKKYNFALD
ncbi:carbamoyltransferase [Pseudaeromonas sp. ZJS20]|uniref:carbamoyltransferase family protein n=1 Tax=Pseudaeromonas aegiceratis TaxID=3153928 RepID=UPI00390CB148